MIVLARLSVRGVSLPRSVIVKNDSKHIGDLFTMISHPTGRLDGTTYVAQLTNSCVVDFVHG